MITLNAKFPKGAEIIRAKCTYDVTKSYYPLKTETITIQDDILNEIKSKGKYTCKAKSDANCGFGEPVKVFDEHISQRLDFPLILTRKEFHNGYYGFTISGKINFQDSFELFVENAKAKNVSLVYIDVVDPQMPIIKTPNVNSYEKLDEMIAKGAPVISKDFSFSNRENSIVFVGNIYISNLEYMQPQFLTFDCEADGYHLETYSVPRIDLQGGSLENYGVSFNSDNYSYPTQIEKLIGTIKPKEPVVLFKNSEVTMFDYFYIYKWSKPNSEISINDMFITDIKVDARNKISVESNISLGADKKLPSFGILSNKGSVEFNDIDGRVRVLAENNLLKKGLEVSIYLENTLTKNQELVGEYYTSEWDYDNENNLVSVSLKDGLEEWQDIFIEGINYDPRTGTARQGAYFYEYLYSKTPKKYKMQSLDKLDDETRSVLFDMIVDYPLLENGTLWQQWTKLCQLCRLYIFKDKEVTTCKWLY